MALVERSPKRATINKEDAESPTISLDSVFITSTIDVKEVIDVAVVYIPGAFLRAHQDPKDGTFIMMILVVVAELLENVAPKLYQIKIIIDSKGEKAVYFEMEEALYGMIISALLCISIC